MTTLPYFSTSAKYKWTPRNDKSQAFDFSTIFCDADREHSQHQETTEQAGKAPQVSLPVTATPEGVKSCSHQYYPFVS